MPNLSALLHDARRKPLEEVATMVPLDDDHRPTSLGSLLHRFGRCKICVSYVRGLPDSCRQGVRCRYCHFQHDQLQSRNQAYKADRLTYKRFLASAERQILANPAHFDWEALELPRFAGYQGPLLRKKLIKHLRLFYLEVQAGLNPRAIGTLPPTSTI